MLLIVLNTLIMCGYHHDMDYELEQGLEYTNLVLTQLFTLELLDSLIYPYVVAGGSRHALCPSPFK